MMPAIKRPRARIRAAAADRTASRAADFPRRPSSVAILDGFELVGNSQERIAHRVKVGGPRYSCGLEKKCVQFLGGQLRQVCDAHTFRLASSFQSQFVDRFVGYVDSAHFALVLDAEVLRFQFDDEGISPVGYTHGCRLA